MRRRYRREDRGGALPNGVGGEDAQVASLSPGMTGALNQLARGAGPQPQLGMEDKMAESRYGAVDLFGRAPLPVQPGGVQPGLLEQAQNPMAATANPASLANRLFRGELDPRMRAGLRERPQIPSFLPQARRR